MSQSTTKGYIRADPLLEVVDKIQKKKLLFFPMFTIKGVVPLKQSTLR